MAGTLLFPAMTLPRPAAAAAIESGRSKVTYARVDAAEIRDQLQQILSDPGFKPNRTFLQWLAEKLSRWHGPSFKGWSGFSRTIYYLVVSWCILSLAAILLHLAWGIYLMIRTDRKRFRIGGGKDRNPADLSPDNLFQTARDLADRKHFRAAAGMLLKGLLKWLDACHILRFHDSKTNGDFIREYPATGPGRDEFMAFVRLFEKAIYGTTPTSPSTYGQMETIVAQLRRIVNEKP